MTTISINDEIYNGLKLEAAKQHRSISSLVEWIAVQHSIRKLSDQELERGLKKLEISA